jgi:hypothetical protein
MSVSSSNRGNSSCRRIKLAGKRQLDAALQQDLTFANHVHEFDANAFICQSALQSKPFLSNSQQSREGWLIANAIKT